ncbi:MAG TPA: L-histidine N(alpha)-methyltransferase [Bacteroidales bacterium]|nr:L-histidine N(alpha)-methyltransferase [Bacteroidales bacterium]
MEQTTKLSTFAFDTLNGLSASSKFLLPRYFYDDNGSRIFQDIMQMPEYYLTDCEFEIFTHYQSEMKDLFVNGNSPFELVELGSGDGLKTKILLNHFVKHKINFKYVAVDISRQANENLNKKLKAELPGLKTEFKTGDYFKMMNELNHDSDHSKVFLFLGSNIGNFMEDERHQFLSQLSDLIKQNDKLLMGFDLKKSQNIILKAYDDPHGYTRAFNLNHLLRINKELDADFDIESFRHVAQYNEQSGETKSFLISNKKQSVYIGALEQRILFQKDEPIYMELSQKFDLETIHQLAQKYGFRVEKNFTDTRNYFVDSLWVKE